MAEVGRPPILRVRHQSVKVLDHRVEVEALKFLGVVERLPHRIGRGRVLVENPKIELVRPPVEVRLCVGSARDGALAFSCHLCLSDRVQLLMICRTKMIRVRGRRRMAVGSRLRAAVPRLSPSPPSALRWIKQVNPIIRMFAGRGASATSSVLAVPGKLMKRFVDSRRSADSAEAPIGPIDYILTSDRHGQSFVP